MKFKIWFVLMLSSCLVISKNQFMGLVEDGSVNKNKFLCPLSLNASGNVVCNDMDAEMVEYDISGGHTIQIFNNQQYWLQQKFERQHILMIQGYTGDRLSSAMTSEGWDHMGAFSIIISTDPIMLKAIEPNKQSAAGQIKLVVQLWYSSATGLQLWAEDVQILNSGQSFKILISNSQSKAFTDSSSIDRATTINPATSASITTSATITNSSNNLPSLSSASNTSASTVTVTTASTNETSTTLDNFKQQFLQQVGFAPNYIDKNVYNFAYGSPRNIQIQIQ